MGTSTQTMNKSDLKLIAVLERTGGFASAQELHQILRREGDGIGLTTVYRALQSLVDDKIVDLLRREDGEAIYRLCGDTHHHHLVCKSCGDTVEIEGGAIEKWAKLWLKSLDSATWAIQPRSSEYVQSASFYAFPLANQFGIATLFQNVYLWMSTPRSLSIKFCGLHRATAHP